MMPSESISPVNQFNLTNNPAIDYSPSWSPDGAKIAFWSSRDGNFEIYVMNSDGTNQIYNSTGKLIKI